MFTKKNKTPGSSFFLQGFFCFSFPKIKTFQESWGTDLSYHYRAKFHLCWYSPDFFSLLETSYNIKIVQVRKDSSKIHVLTKAFCVSRQDWFSSYGKRPISIYSCILLSNEILCQNLPDCTRPSFCQAHHFYCFPFKTTQLWAENTGLWWINIFMELCSMWKIACINWP